MSKGQRGRSPARAGAGPATRREVVLALPSLAGLRGALGSRMPRPGRPTGARARWLLAAALVVAVGAAAAWRLKDVPRWRLFGVTESSVPAPDLSQVDSGTADLIRAARAAIVGSPDSADAWFDYGMVLEASGITAFAIPAYEEAARLAPGDMRPRYFLAIVLDGVGRGQEAVEIFRALTTDPSVPLDRLPLVYIRLGDALLAGGDSVGAEDAYLLAVSMASELPAAHLGLGRALVANGKPAEAIEPLERAAEMLGPDRAAHAALVEAYRATGQVDKAAETARKAEGMAVRRVIHDDLRVPITRLKPEYRQARERGMLALRLDRYDDAIAELKLATEAWPDDYQAHVALSTAYEKAGQAAPAAQYRGMAEAILRRAGVQPTAATPAGTGTPAEAGDGAPTAGTGTPAGAGTLLP